MCTSRQLHEKFILTPRDLVRLNKVVHEIRETVRTPKYASNMMTTNEVLVSFNLSTGGIAIIAERAVLDSSIYPQGSRNTSKHSVCRRGRFAVGSPPASGIWHYSELIIPSLEIVGCV